VEKAFEKKLRHLDVLNALKLIKGEVKLDVEQLKEDFKAFKN